MTALSKYIEELEEIEDLRIELNSLKKERDGLAILLKNIDLKLIRIEAEIQEKERELGG